MGQPLIEGLVNIMSENDNLEYNDLYMLEEQSDVGVVETVEIIDVFDTQTYEVDSDVAFPALGETNEGLKHQLLNGKELPDQHPITSITGLRNELDTIEALQTIYSDSKQVADFYEWADYNAGAEDRFGYFVSVCGDLRRIEICSNEDIFGVTVDSAAFVGGQDEVTRDYTYGLVVHSGLVDVRCELDVNVGDYVVSNKYGVAKKTGSNYGCKVIALKKIKGVVCATIMLDISDSQIFKLGNEVEVLNDRMDAAETNISSAFNLINNLDTKIKEANQKSEDINDSAKDALNQANKIVQTMTDEEWAQQIAKAKELSAQAKVIADNAIVHAETLKQEAVEKANEALADTSELREEFKDLSSSMSSDLSGAVAELQDTVGKLDDAAEDMRTDIRDAVDGLKDLRDEMTPLSTWSEFYECKLETSVAKNTKCYFVINDKTYTFACPVDVVSGKTIQYNFTKKIITVEKSTTKATTTEDITGMTELKFMPSGDKQSFAGFVAQADEDGATLASMVEWRGDGGESLTAFVQDTTAGNATVSAIASYQKTDKDGNPIGEGGAAGLLSEVDDLGSKISVIADYTYTDEDGNTIEGISGLTAQVAQNKANIDLLSKLEGGDFESLAGLSTQVTKNKSQLDAVASYECEDENGNLVSGLAGLKEQVDKNKAGINLVSRYTSSTYKTVDSFSKEREENGLDTETIYYAKDTKKYWYYDNEWTDTLEPPGLAVSMSGLMTDNDANKAELQAVSEYTYTDGDVTEKGLAGLREQVDKNKSEVSLVASKISGKYTIIEELPSEENDRNTDKWYHSAYSKYWYYKDGKWNNYESWTDFKNNISVNTDMVYYSGGKYKKYLYCTDKKNNTWKSTDDPSWAGLPSAIAGIQAVVDENSSTISSLASWQGKTNTSLASIEQKADDNGAYIQGLVANIDKYSVGEYSQAYGLTIQQADSVLEVGTAYVPTKTHTETYKSTDTKWAGYTRQLTQGYLYIWKDKVKDDGAPGWEAHKEVTFSSTELAVTSADKYWYTSGDNVTNLSGSTAKYEPYTLYKSESYKSSGETKYHWVAVATLKGNSTNRSVSLIRQETNAISAELTSARGNYSGLNLRLNNVDSTLTTVTSWGNKITTLEQKSNANGATTSLVAGELMTSVTSLSNSAEFNGIDDKDTSKIYVYPRQADGVNIYRYFKDNEWKSTLIPANAGVKIKAASIVSAINKSGDTSIALNADYINLSGFTSVNGYFHINTLGEMIATGGQIAGWHILDNIIYKSQLSSDMKKTYAAAMRTNASMAFAVYEKSGGSPSEAPSISGGWSYNFYVSYDGILYAQKANITGAITATSLTLSGCTLPAAKVSGLSNVATTGKYSDLSGRPTSLSDLEDDLNVMKTDDVKVTSTTSGNITTTKITVGKNTYTTYTSKSSNYLLTNVGTGTASSNHSTSYFKVSTDGLLTAHNAMIYGTVYATDGEFTGKITSTSGQIAGWNIVPTSLYKTKYDSTNKKSYGAGMFASDTGVMALTVTYKDGDHTDEAPTNSNGWNYNFYVKYNGELYAKNATIEGTLKAGKIADGVGLGNTQYTTFKDYKYGEEAIYYGTSWTHKDYPNSSIILSNNNVSISSHMGILFDATDGTFRFSNGGNGSSGTVIGYLRVSEDDNGIDHMKFMSYGYVDIYSNETKRLTCSSSGGSLKGTWTADNDLSDARLKHTIESLDDRYEMFFDSLRSQRYKYNHGTSDRFHTGYIAQEVVESLENANISTQEFAGVMLVKDEETNEDYWYLRRDEFIALNTWQIQKAKARITELETKIAKLEEKIETLIKE